MTIPDRLATELSVKFPGKVKENIPLALILPPASVGRQICLLLPIQRMNWQGSYPCSGRGRQNIYPWRRLEYPDQRQRRARDHGIESSEGRPVRKRQSAQSLGGIGGHFKQSCPPLCIERVIRTRMGCDCPGTIGGAAYGNAGAFGGDIAGNLICAELLTDAGRRIWPVDRLSYGYRTSIFKAR